MTICLFGRQPGISIAELEALYGADAIRPVGTQAALVDTKINFERLGGSQKAGQVLTSVPGTNPQKAFAWLQKNIVDIVGATEGKLKLGISIYSLSMSPQKIGGNALTLKKVLRSAGHSVRVVPNTESELSSAQTYHNNLTDERGYEFMIIRDGDSMLIARATHVQGIDAYRKRDQERPHRDAFVGMLPPKLAQTIVNLAAHTLDDNKISTTPTTGEPSVSSDHAEKDLGGSIKPLTLLDPFCGTGVVLQEASLMGYQVYGTDLNEKMVRYTRDNLNWLFEKYRMQTNVFYETADATDHQWRKPIDIVACEAYLGHPFASEPTREALNETIQTCNVIMRKFLRNLSSQIEPGTPLCIAVPAWFVRGTVHHLPILEELQGYIRIDFVHAKREDLIYHREDQIVGRELIVLRKSSPQRRPHATSA